MLKHFKASTYNINVDLLVFYFFNLKHAILQHSFLLFYFYYKHLHLTMSNTFFTLIHFQELNECDPNPCLNNGTCVDGVRNYTCNCASVFENNVLNFFTGRNCSTSEIEAITLLLFESDE